MVQAVRGRVEVYVDGGVRTGTDVLKALALGARAVFIGRPILYGLAVGVSNYFSLPVIHQKSFATVHYLLVTIPKLVL